jgi:hypothetical protein
MGLWCLMVAAGAVFSCASEADLEAQYSRGIKAARASDWKAAFDDLEPFTAKACGEPHRSPHCREAFVALGRGYEQRGEPARAWVAFDTGLALPPHARDQAVRDDLERVERELADRQAHGHDRGPVLVRYRDEVTEEYTARSVTVSIDFSPVFTNDRHAGELHSPDFTKVWGGSITAGPHVLVVEAEHGCVPGQASRCAGGRVHHAWFFDTRARTPLTLEVRAFAEARGDAAARPALELQKR